LKPLEAAAHGKAMLVSSVTPLKEFANETRMAALFEKGDVEDLTTQMSLLLRDSKRRAHYESAAKQLALERTWNSVTAAITDAYCYHDSQWVTQLVTTTPHEQDQATVHKRHSAITHLDPISELCWSTEIDNAPLERKNYQTQIKESNNDFAFLESAWRANQGQWEYAFTSPGLKHANAQALLDALSLFKKRELPIVFWNKEDPMHYDLFRPISKHADFIFTTDELSVEKYKREFKH